MPKTVQVSPEQTEAGARTYEELIDVLRTSMRTIELVELPATAFGQAWCSSAVHSAWTTCQSSALGNLHGLEEEASKDRRALHRSAYEFTEADNESAERYVDVSMSFDAVTKSSDIFG